jgi:hypothetical protein
LSGIEQTRVPVAANTALATAGASIGYETLTPRPHAPFHRSLFLQGIYVSARRTRAPPTDPSDMANPREMHWIGKGNRAIVRALPGTFAR